MVEKIALGLIHQMEQEKMINREDVEQYEYALVSMAERAIAVGSMLIIGIIAKQLIPTICFLIFFLSLRKRTGGYHANEFWQCYLVTIITYAVVTQAAAWLSEHVVSMYIMLPVAVLVIEAIGTVNHPNMDMDRHELREAKKAARILVLLEAVVIVTLIYMGFSSLYVSYLSIAIILCATLLLLAKLLKQEVR